VILSRLFIGVKVTFNLKDLPFFKVSFLRFSLIFFVVILFARESFGFAGAVVFVLEEAIFASVTEYTFPHLLQVLDFSPFSVVVGSFTTTYSP
jgi:integral membrane sensor domain MASE1